MFDHCNYRPYLLCEVVKYIQRFEVRISGGDEKLDKQKELYKIKTCELFLIHVYRYNYHKQCKIYFYLFHHYHYQNLILKTAGIYNHLVFTATYHHAHTTIVHHYYQTL